MRTLLLALLCVPALAAQVEPARDTPPNVLFIAIDDLRPALGCYGVEDARTPSLDRLAAQGTRFTQHYVQVPTCGASRYALLTGRSPARSRALGNGALHGGRTAIDALQHAGAQTLPEQFRRSGYRTICIGKISHTADGRVFAYNGNGDGRVELPHAWDELRTPFGPWGRGWGVFFAYEGGRHREDGQGNRDLWEFRAEADEDLPDGLMASEAIATLAECAAGERPFFLGLGFFKPHLPFVATRGDWEAMQQVEIVPPNAPERLYSSYWHNSGEFYKYAAAHDKTRPLAPEARVESRRAYLACVRYVDRQVGRVLDALDELGLADDTIVVVWGDHGWHLGESAIWGKHALFDRALQSALIVRAPGVGRAGAVCDALVETTDLFPTLLELCAPSFQETRFPLDGHSLVPLLTGERSSVREHALSYQGRDVSVRSATHRLIARRGEAGPQRVELYDLRAGPDPTLDLASEEPERVQAMLAAVPQAWWD